MMNMIHSLLQAPTRKRHTKDIVMGTTLGVAAGIALGAMGHDYYKQNRRTLKRNAQRYLRTAENLMSGVTSMIR